jgi:hypothetical protein
MDSYLAEVIAMPLTTPNTKTAARPSHEAVESTGGTATNLEGTEQQQIDRVAMDLAKRAQNRIHEDEGSVPGNQIFTK